MEPVIFRIGLPEKNWKETLGQHVWGVPQNRRNDSQVQKINELIECDGAVIAVFLKPGGRKRGNEGSVVALSLLSKPIDRFEPGEQLAFNWQSAGSNTLQRQPEPHRFGHKVQLGDVLLLQGAPELRYAALTEHNGLDDKQRPKHLVRNAVQFPQAELRDYLLQLCADHWTLV